MTKFEIMKERDTYPNVKKLHPQAMSIDNFAKENGFSNSYPYKLHERGKLRDMGKRIVIFQGYNFVVPCAKK